MQSRLNIFKNIFDDHVKIAQKTIHSCIDDIDKAASLIISCVKNDGRIFLCGNGGSASDCQHIAAEFVGRFEKERKGLPAIALTTDNSILTAVGNDYGYDNIFSRQIEALARPDDIVVGISTSGNSKNVVNALEKAKTLKCWTIGLSGFSGGELKKVSDICIKIPSTSTARIQEMHIMIGHMLCALIDGECL